MTDPLPRGSPSPAERPSDDRLESWKEIAAYMRRDVTTVQRWEKREDMPVHRHLHDKMGSVYAFRSELDAWTERRKPPTAAEGESPSNAETIAVPVPAARTPPWWRTWAAILTSALLAIAAAWQAWKTAPATEQPLANVRFSPLTDFEGIEQAAAVSRDGRFVAFLSNRDGQMDVWITQVGAGQFYNLTRGAIPELVNPSVRTLGFSPDGTLVTFWARRTDPSHPTAAIGVWAVPVLGGQPRPYLEGAAEIDWSADGARLAYHTPDPGDPMFVRRSGQPARSLFAAPRGLHTHFPVWSPEQAFIYFVQGTPPDRMDIWRIGPDGGSPERITHHASLVSHPVFVAPRTLLYLATDENGLGPWIYSVDVDERLPRRITGGLDRYTSLAASADGRRLVATLANPKGVLWRIPFADAQTGMAHARRVALTTSNGSAPRWWERDRLLYVSSRGSGHTLWALQGDRSTALWSAPDARIFGGPAVAPDGGRVAFTIEQQARTALVVTNVDGTGARVLPTPGPVQGSPAWRPDGRTITVAALVDGEPRLFNVPLDGSPPAPLVHEYSVHPAWSPDGAFVLYSGPDIGATFEVRAAAADGGPYALPPLTLTRGARHLRVTTSRQVMILRGEIGHKDLWRVDLATGAEKQVTHLPPGFAVRDFDVSPDGRELVIEQIQDQSDIVLLEIRK